MEHNEYVVLDLETTGIDVNNDRIVQFCAKRIRNNIEVEELNLLINPGMPIPSEATDIHNITAEMVADKPLFKEVSSKIHSFIKSHVLIGYNHIRFDCPLLFNEFTRAGIVWHYLDNPMIDIANIYKQKEPRTLEMAVRYYLQKQPSGAHDAANDVSFTFKIFQKMLQRYDLPDDINELAKFSNYGKSILDVSGKLYFNENEQVCFSFGKWKDEPVSMHKDYANWMLKTDFPKDTKMILLKEINGGYPWKRK